MPARLPELEVVPHYQAVQLAHDTPLKREVIALAEQLMAAPLRLLLAAHDTNQQCLRRASDYLRALHENPPREEDEKPRRDPNLVSFAQSNRAVSLGAALCNNIDRLREQCYRQAREVVYQRTLKRVGPRFWPSEAAAAGIAPDPSEDRPAAVMKTVSLAGDAQGTATTARAEAQRSPDVAPEPDFTELETSTVTKRTLRRGQDEMLRAGVDRNRQIEVARKAKQECWTVGQFYGEVSKLIAVEGSVGG